MEKSVFTKSGPPTGSVRGALPSSPAAGCEKHAVLNHSDSVGLLSAGLQVMLGRINALPFAFRRLAPEVLLLSMSKIGKPDVACSITVASQPPRIALAAAFQLLPHLRPFAEWQVVNDAGSEILIQIDLRKSPIQALPYWEGGNRWRR